MRYSAETEVSGGGTVVRPVLKQALEERLRPLHLVLVELDIFRGKARKSLPPAVQIRAVVYKDGSLGTNECAQAHHAMLPCLEQEFPDCELYIEVSTPGINRIIKDGAEFFLYRGRGIRCWRSDISDWTAGVLETVDDRGIIIQNKEGTIRLDFGLIQKARLDPSQEE